ncbi:hypothetical protein [Saezia sanguinis]|uniref:hypothetical protein n=1 Tax=Saezia sanguinis TaxID=1965230 RepID=UPI003060E4CD
MTNPNTHPPEPPAQYIQRFQTCQTQYQQLRAQAHAQVVRWVWASGMGYHLEPFYLEEHHYPASRIFKKPPAQTRGKHRYGLNAQDEVIVSEEQYMRFPRRDYDQFYERFIFRKPGSIETVYFHYAPEKPLVNTTFYRCEQGLIHEAWLIGRNGWNHRTYTYDNGTLRHQQQDFPYAGQIRQRHFDYVCTPAGGLERITEAGRIIYARLPAGINFTQLETLAVQQLETAIVQALQAWAAAHPDHNPIYAVFVSYGSETLFPPQLTLGMGAAAHRQTRPVHDNAPGAYDPNEIQNTQLQIDDLPAGSAIEGLDVYELYNQQAQMLHRENRQNKKIVEICQRLRARFDAGEHWNLRTTGDFCIVPSHWELSDLKKNFKAVNPRWYEQLKPQLPD